MKKGYSKGSLARCAPDPLRAQGMKTSVWPRGFAFSSTALDHDNLKYPQQSCGVCDLIKFLDDEHHINNESDLCRICATSCMGKTIDDHQTKAKAMTLSTEEAVKERAEALMSISDVVGVGQGLCDSNPCINQFSVDMPRNTRHWRMHRDSADFEDLWIPGGAVDLAYVVSSAIQVADQWSKTGV